MKWSWKVGEIAGIDLRIHATFLLLVGWVWVSYWMAGKSMDALVAGIGFIFALFGCVLLHELGHALAARKFGIQTRDITLLPIGGVARLERMPEDPRQELWVALAGPAVNVAIAAVLYGWLILTHGWAPSSQLTVTAGPFVERLLMANISLVLFNLIPAFPMDGGRVLRALLASRMTYPRATQLAATVGQGLAFVFGFVGMFTNPMLLFIGLFVWIGASQEAYAVQMKSALSGTPARAAMLTDFRALQAGDTLADAVRLILRGSQHDFPVIDQGRVTGILTRTDLLIALTEHGQDHPVTLAMRREFMIAEPGEMLEMVFQRLRECDCHTMPVVHDGRLVGLVTMDNLGEYLLIDAALQKRGLSSTESHQFKRRSNTMMFKTTTRRVSMLAILSLLPAAFLVGETSKQVQAEKEGIELTGQLEEVARDVRYNAERLNSFTRDAHISRWTHYHHLEQIKGLVNDGLRPALDRLTEIQPEMPEWKQHGIDRMLASAKALAADTNSAILAKNEGGATPAMLNAEYRQLIARIMEHSEALVKTSDAMGTYAAAHQKALDAGLKVTK